MRVLRFPFSKSLFTTTALAFIGVSCFSPVVFAGGAEDGENVPTALTPKRKALEDENPSKRTKLSASEDLNAASPVAFAEGAVDGEKVPTALTPKRKALKDKNPSKKTKLSTSEDLNADNSLVAVDMNTPGAIPEEFDVGKALVIALPSHVIYTLSTFLSPSEGFNLALTCKSLGVHLPHLPMWQDLIDRSQLSEGERRPLYAPNLPKYYSFKLALDNNYRAKSIYADWLLSHNLSQKVAARQLSQIVIHTEASPLEICDALHLIENFSLWDKVNSRIDVSSLLNSLLINMSVQDPLRDVTDYLRAVMRVQNRIGDALLTLPGAYQMLIESSQSQALPADMRAAADYYRAMMRVQNRAGIGDALLTLHDAYQLLVGASQNKALSAKLRDVADYYRAVLREAGIIGEDLLTISDAYQLLVVSSQKQALSARERAEAVYRGARMRIDNRIGEEILSDHEAYQRLVGLSGADASEWTRSGADYYRALMRFQSRIGEDLLTDLDAYQLLLRSGQSKMLPANMRAASDGYRAMMRVRTRIGDDLLTFPDAYQLLVEVSQNQDLSEVVRANANNLINQLKAQNRIPTSTKGNG
ncbi:MAG: hypothetical protein JSR85_07835 [Proteobacteria bacterium]|nr:hypothetical protein [Pseudomonadota bacterium]